MVDVFSKMTKARESGGTMNLDLIDQLAWFKIIGFLDNNTRLKCRLLSRTIKAHVDYIGLQLKIHEKKNHSRGAWTRFLEDPTIFLNKLTVKQLSLDSELIEPLLPRRDIFNLSIRGSVAMVPLERAKWRIGLTTLSFHEDSLGEFCFAGWAEEALCDLSNLKTLILSHPNTQTKHISGKVCRNLTYLLERVRSKRLEAFWFNAYGHKFIAHQEIRLLEAFKGFARTHSGTLQTFILDYTFSLADQSSVEKEDLIPLGLKCLSYSCRNSSDPYWIQSLAAQQKLEELHLSYWEPVNPPLSQIYGNNCDTLKFLDLSLLSGPILDLGILSSCHQLHTLLICVGSFLDQGHPIFVGNISKLPISLKAFRLTVTRGVVTLNSEAVADLKELSNLAALKIQHVEIPNHENTRELLSTLFRLRKLCVLALGLRVRTTEEDQDEEPLQLILETFGPLGLFQHQGSLDLELSLKGKDGGIWTYPNTLDRLSVELRGRQRKGSMTPVLLERLKLNDLQISSQSHSQ